MSYQQTALEAQEEGVDGHVHVEGRGGVAGAQVVPEGELPTVGEGCGAPSLDGMPSSEEERDGVPLSTPYISPLSKPYISPLSTPYIAVCRRLPA